MRRHLLIGALVVALLVSVGLLVKPKAQASAHSPCTPKNASAAVNNAVTLTITPPVGMFVYFCSWDITVSGNATPTAQNAASWTSTNLGASGSTWSWTYSIGAATAGAMAIYTGGYPGAGDVFVRSQTAGTAVTFVSPTAAANNAYSINAFYFFDY